MKEFAIEPAKTFTKTYGSIHAVAGINLTVPRGSIYGFLGRNGAGKTNYDQDAIGPDTPDCGHGSCVGDGCFRRAHGRSAAYRFVSEKKTLYPSLTASELVRFSRGFYPTWSDGAVEKYARLLEIPMKQRFEKLSNGNQTKVWLLLALAQRWRIWLILG